MSSNSYRLSMSLLIVRISIAMLMVPWAVDKIVRPDHATHVFEQFYFINAAPGALSFAAGALQLVVLFAFLIGYARTWTYGFVLAMHAVSTLSTWREYLDPYQGANLLLFAAWPALGACIALFILREFDNLLSVHCTAHANHRREQLA